MSEKDPDLKYPEEARSGNPTLTELDAMGGEPIADRPDINPLEEEIARLRAEIEGHLAKSETRERAIADLLIQKKTLEDRVGKMNVPLPSKKLIHHEDYLEGRHFRIGLVSDTHIGSTMARIDLLEKAYDIFNKDGVQRVYHAGDMCSGDSVYRGQQYETLYPGFQAQKKAVIDNYPQLKDGKTFFILGNHDYSFIKKSNSNLGLDIPDKRKDLNYVGEIVADVQISGSDPLDDATAEDNRAPGTTLRLFHPTGGLAYALSYKPQRYVDNLPSDGRKPNILVIGHYHTRCSFDRRNIKVYQVPCFEEESPYLIEKGLQPTIGFSWLDIQLSREGSIVGMMVKEYTYYAGVGFTSGFGPEED